MAILLFSVSLSSRHRDSSRTESSTVVALLGISKYLSHALRFFVFCSGNNFQSNDMNERVASLRTASKQDKPPSEQASLRKFPTTLTEINPSPPHSQPMQLTRIIYLSYFPLPLSYFHSSLLSTSSFHLLPQNSPIQTQPTISLTKIFS